ncbi:MAG: hypothetical protein RLZZ298_2522 [Pseudomonadota bacterium]|jgi:hypothetical protein
MNPKSLSDNQQAILYSLLFHMVLNGELNLATASRANAKEADALDHYRNLAAIAQDMVAQSQATGNAKTAHDLLSSGELESLNFLGMNFEVERTVLFFPGITNRNLVGEDACNERCFEQLAGDLRFEFADSHSRTTLFSNFEHWIGLDPAFVSKPDGILAKVKAELNNDERITA